MNRINRGGLTSIKRRETIKFSEIIRGLLLKTDFDDKLFGKYRVQILKSA
jgi:hypothetical protein